MIALCWRCDEREAVEIPQAYGPPEDRYCQACYDNREPPDPPDGCWRGREREAYEMERAYRLKRAGLEVV